MVINNLCQLRSIRKVAFMDDIPFALFCSETFMWNAIKTQLFLSMAQDAIVANGMPPYNKSKRFLLTSSVIVSV